MRPIFENERLLLTDALEIEIPKYSYMERMLIYSNGKKFIRFTAKDSILKMTKDHRKEGEDYNGLSFLENSTLRKNEIDKLTSESISFIKQTVNDIKDRLTVVSYSGGKDSEVVYDLIKKSGIEYDILVSDTSNEMPETYKRWMSMQKEYGDRFHWTKPKLGMYKYFKDKNVIPTQQSRICCTMYKKQPLKDFIYEIHKPLLNFNGVRWEESAKRAGRSRISINELYGEIDGLPKNTEAMPIVSWTEEQVWDYIFLNDLPYNTAYELGFSRVGCRMCPYMSNYTLKIVEEQTPATHRTYQKLLSKVYDETNTMKLEFTKLMDEGLTGEQIKEKMGMSGKKYASWKKRYDDGEREMYTTREEYLNGKWRG